MRSVDLNSTHDEKPVTQKKGAENEFSTLFPSSNMLEGNKSRTAARRVEANHS
jgi:hypothetical protein